MEGLLGKILEYIDKGTKLIASLFFGGGMVLALYYWAPSGIAKIPNPVGAMLPGAIYASLGLFGGALGVHLVVAIRNLFKTRSEQRKIEALDKAKIEAKKQAIEAEKQETLHFLERLEDDEKLLLAWLVQTKRDYFTFKMPTGAVKSLTGKGIVLASDKVAFYRDVPKFVLDRLTQMDELKRIRLPRDLPWMHEGSFYG